MNFDILRQRILEKAIQGKLVPQLESEPDVAQISETLDDVPFAVPEKWKWVRILDAACINPKVIATDSNINVSFIPMAAVSAGYLNYIALKEEKPWKTVKNGYTKFADRDILIAKITPCFQNRKSAIAHSLINGIGCGSSEFHVLRTNENILDQNYLLLFLKSPWFIAYGVENFKGTAGQQRLGTSELKNCRLPLPPLSEQRRIVAKTEKLFEQISRAEEAYNEISGPLSERFRQLCLEKAIQGKLVPQLESEPAVEQIGTVPKVIPFTIPPKWKWINIGHVIDLISGRDLNKIDILEDKKDNSLPYITGASQIINNKIIENRWTLKPCVISFPGDLLLTCKGTVGKLGINNLGEIHIARQIMAIRPKKLVEVEYLKIYFLAIMQQLEADAKSMIPGISRKNILEKAIPLPPLAEQRRIIDSFHLISSKIVNLSL